MKRTTRQLTLKLILLSLILHVSASAIGQGLQIYLVKAAPGFREPSKCAYCFELTDSILFDNSLLEQADVEYFDWENQTIHLREEAKEKITRLKIPLEGRAAAIVMDGKLIYGFWLWNVVSSFGCDRVYAYPALDIKLEFGLPHGYAFGSDPRFDTRLKNGLLRDGLMK